MIPVHHDTLVIRTAGDDEGAPVNAYTFFDLSSAGSDWVPLQLDWEPVTSAVLYGVHATATSEQNAESLISGNGIRVRINSVSCNVNPTAIMGHLVSGVSLLFDIKLVPSATVRRQSGLITAKLTFQPTQLPVPYGAGEAYPVPVGAGIVTDKPTYRAELLLLLFNSGNAAGVC